VHESFNLAMSTGMMRILYVNPSMKRALFSRVALTGQADLGLLLNVPVGVKTDNCDNAQCQVAAWYLSNLLVSHESLY
jgi:hypothetical protein